MANGKDRGGRVRSPSVAGELAGLVQPLRLLAAAPRLARRRSGPGRATPVVVLPGRHRGDASTLPLRTYLASQGFEVHGWGLGANDRSLAGSVAAVVERLEQGGAPERPAALVGQSLGGSVAREVARRRPDLVAQVVTIGSPVLRPLGPEPLTVPVTALWSAADRIVPPGWARSGEPGVRHVEVGSTHLAMGLDPDVWEQVRARLVAGGPTRSPVDRR